MRHLPPAVLLQHAPLSKSISSQVSALVEGRVKELPSPSEGLLSRAKALFNKPQDKASLKDVLLSTKASVFISVEPPIDDLVNGVELTQSGLTWRTWPSDKLPVSNTAYEHFLVMHQGGQIKFAMELNSGECFLAEEAMDDTVEHALTEIDDALRENDIVGQVEQVSQELAKAFARQIKNAPVQSETTAVEGHTHSQLMQIACPACHSTRAVTFTYQEKSWKCHGCGNEGRGFIGPTGIEVHWDDVASGSPESQDMPRDLAYSILGVSASVSAAELKKAYRKAAGKCHPDRHAHLPEEMRRTAEGEMKRVNLAYEVLQKIHQS